MPPTFTMHDTMLWDEILKAVVASMPEQLFPLFKEVFGKEYPPDTPIVLLATEHSTFLENPDAPPGSRFSDITLLVNNIDYYHLECQMHNDGNLVIRMLVYDLHFATQHAVHRNNDSGESIMHFPRSAVIYPEMNKSLPASLKCRIIFQDGSEHLYQVPTVQIQSYSLSEILEKHLDLFIPYTVLRLRPRLKSKHQLTKKELTDFVKEVIVLLEKECQDGYLTPQQVEDYTHLFQNAARKVFGQHRKFQKEVLRMTKPLIELPSVKYQKYNKKIEELEHRAAMLQDDLDSLTEALKSEIANKKCEIASKNSEIASKDFEIASKDSEIASKDFEIASKDSEIAMLKAKLAQLSPTNS